MTLINDFADIPRFVGFLNSEYQKKLLGEIDSLLVRFMDEQTRVPVPITENQAPTTPAPVNLPPPAIIDTPEKSSFVQTMNKSNPQAVQEAMSGINNLKNTFKAPANNLPPPPAQTMSAVPFNATRTITAGTLNLKTNITNNASNKMQTKKQTMALVDAWSYLTPYITEAGIKEAQNPSIKMDVYQLMKHIDNNSSLKEVYLYLYPTSDPWAKFLELLYPLSRERCILIKKTKDFPVDIDIPVRLEDYFISKGLINSGDLEKAIEYQKNPPPPNPEKTEPAFQAASTNWMDRAKSLIDKVEKPQSQQQQNLPIIQKKIGEVFLELNMVTKDELDDALTIQKWIRNLLEYAK